MTALAPPLLGAEAQLAHTQGSKHMAVKSYTSIFHAQTKEFTAFGTQSFPTEARQWHLHLMSSCQPGAAGHTGAQSALFR